MARTAFSGRGSPSQRRLVAYRPRLEMLEQRLPPGDALLGLLLAWPDFVSHPANAEYYTASVSVDFDDNSIPIDGLVYPISRAQEETSSMLSSASRGPIRGRPVMQHDDAIHGFAAPNAAVAHRDSQAVRMSHAVSAASVSLSRLTPAAQGNANSVVALNAPSIATSLLGESAGDPSNSSENYGKLDLAFEENVGQTDSRVDFTARAGGYTAFLTPAAAVFAIQNSEFRIQNSEAHDWRAGSVSDRRSPHANTPVANTPGSPGVALHMQIVGANPDARAAGVNPLDAKVNYFMGNDPSQWHANIPTFGRVEYQDVYPGIDLAYYSKDQQLEYDFIVSPGADPNVIELSFAGADSAEIDSAGNLVLHTEAGDLVQQTPYLYQEANAARNEVRGDFNLRTEAAAFHVTFDIGDYDSSRPLVIDPLFLSYSTYLGGPGAADDANSMAVDGGGNVYVVGTTSSTKFPATPGAFDEVHGGGANEDVYIAKLNTTGTGLVYATYLGGGGRDFGEALAIDATGSVYVAGYTFGGFPTTSGAYDTFFGGNYSDAFVAKLNPDGSDLVYSTYLGGPFFEEVGRSMDVDSDGNVYVTGVTQSTTYPTTAGAYDTTFGGAFDAFVTKLNASGTALVYSTFIGGPTIAVGNAITVDNSGFAYVVGETGHSFPTTAGAYDVTFSGHNDAFVLKLTQDGAGAVYATYLGHIEEESVTGIAVDAAGSAYVTGFTRSIGYPTTPGAFDDSYGGGAADAFVTKFNPAGSGLVYSTFLGGVGDDFMRGIALDGAGFAYLAGYTTSTDFPMLPSAYDSSYNGGEDAVLVKFNIAGTSPVYATYIGGSSAFPIGGDYGSAVAVDGTGNAYITGQTYGSDFPTTPGALKRRNRAGQADAFVTKFVEV